MDINCGVATMVVPSSPSQTNYIACPSNLIYDYFTDGESVQALAQAHLVLLMLPLLGPWVLPCFKCYTTILISYKFRTSEFYTTSRTLLTWFTMLMSSISDNIRCLTSTLVPRQGVTNAL